jgi:membrane fusion protein, antimicrobial resistance system
VAQPSRADIKVDFLATGTTESREFELSGENWGTLKEILVEKDDLVKKGQPLAILMDTTVEERLENLQRELAVMRRHREESAVRLQLRRVQLRSQSLTSQAEGQKARAAYRETVADPTSSSLQVAQASVDEAQAQLRQSRRERERLQQLFDEDIASQAQVERAQMEEEINLARRTRAIKELEQLKRGVTKETKERARAQMEAVEVALPRSVEVGLELDLLEEQLETTDLQILHKEAEISREREKVSRNTLRSPIDGQVLEILRQTGEIVRHAPIMNLVDINEVWVEADVAEQDSSYVQVGQTVTVHLPSLEGSRFSGVVESTGAALRTPQGVVGNARFLEIKVRLEQKVDGLRPGLEADVEGSRLLAEDVLTVPHQAVVREGNQSFVVVVEGSTARRVPVTLGVSDAEKIEVKSGLQETQKVVLDHPSRFVADTKVEVRT